eukprot:UN25121
MDSQNTFERMKRTFKGTSSMKSIPFFVVYFSSFSTLISLCCFSKIAIFVQSGSFPLI